MAKSPEEYAHLEWLGYVQPTGLVVSIPALLEAQCYVDKNIMAEHTQFLASLRRDEDDQVVAEVRDLAEFTQSVLGWNDSDLEVVPQAPTGDMAQLEVVLPQYNETLRPTHVVPAYKPNEGEPKWMMLVQELATGTDFDVATEADSSRHWSAAPHAKFERLLRESEVPIGLLYNGSQFRLVYAPRGETSGYATFNVDEMGQVAGRPMFAAFYMLLCVDRLFTLAPEQCLPAILENSRKYQSNVSTKLAEQVTSALFELLRGFQAADDHRSGELLRDILKNNPQHVYNGLLTVLMRLVFVLYAEDRGVLSTDSVYANHYSVSGLFQRLRSDAGRFPDTMDQRFGAWSQLLTLFRLVFQGAKHNEFQIPPRKGYLFDPDRYPFLEGRYDDGDVDVSSPEEQCSVIQIPQISDGVIYRVLEDLLILDGERLSYRTLDVEQIGSVYEAVMGFQLEVATGKSIAIKPVKSHGAPATVNLESLLEAKPANRSKLLKEWTDQKLGASDAKSLKDASSIEEIVEALGKKIARHVTPSIVPSGSMVFQPSEERRRSGSHYTPRSLTEPIVRTTLEPILRQLCDPDSDLPSVYKPSSQDKDRYTKGEIAARVRQSEKHIEYATAAREKGVPHPNQILDLKICDPAMGSGAFLVETCRQLGDELILAWAAHDMQPSDIPPDEDEVLYARRLVAQRCLYGVDKNVMAVDLAKLSLWLVTLAQDHAFTFLDHALRHGDSLVGLTRRQIIGFHWEPKKQKKFGEDYIQKRLDRATEARAKILNAREDVPYKDQEQRLAVADEALDLIRILGDACVSCFFAESKKKAREEEADRVYGLASSYLESQKQPQVDHASRTGLQEAAALLRDSSQEHPVPAFHWEIEFPEVFSRENGGFDAFVGNPPFLGGKRISGAFGSSYRDWLPAIHAETNSNSDLVAHFFRRAFNLLRKQGTLGLIGTNTISQGDTRATGLRWICNHGGQIYWAKRRGAWPGVAAVVVSFVHIFKGQLDGLRSLDGKQVERITAFLYHAGGNDDPFVLQSNEGLSYQGCIVLGMGFTFDSEPNDVSGTLEEMHELIAANPRNQDVIFPYIGGEELLRSPIQSPRRYVINFGGRTLEECEAEFPDLLEIVRERVKPARDELKRDVYRNKWWMFAERQTALCDGLATLDRALMHSFTSSHLAFAFIPADTVFAGPHCVFLLDGYGYFCTMQSRIHERWARFTSSTLKDDLSYKITDCFETFPFPLQVETLDDAGQAYYDLRAQVMISNDEGLTKTYNRFHSPDERDEGILELRRLHGLMDGAVLRAYGWDDLAESAAADDFCEFLLDYEEEEDDDAPASTKKKSKKKKPWRYRWPDDFRDEVLARLLELNEQRHKEEQIAGKLADGESKKKTPARNKTSPPSNPGQTSFLE
ncbi:MAG: Eco57I restriction-modification methylase domain-containing protein [Aureliella sp.]